MIGPLQSVLSARQLARRDGAAVYVLVYHGVVPTVGDLRLERNFHEIATFRQQARLLARLNTVPLAELESWLECGEFPTRGTSVAITFDDGFANTLDAASILAKRKIPWTLFIATDAIEQRSTIWTAELSLLLLHGEAARVELLGAAWSLDDRPMREDAFQRIRTALKRMPAAPRRGAMDALRAQMPVGETERLLARFPAFRSMVWNDVRQLATAGVEIGSHGVHHELHHAAQPAPARRAELVESRRAIEAHTERPCRYFSFPNGATTAGSDAEVQAAGYSLAFSTAIAAVMPGSDRYTLPRLPAGNSVKRLIERLRDPREAEAHP